MECRSRQDRLRDGGQGRAGEERLDRPQLGGPGLGLGPLAGQRGRGSPQLKQSHHGPSLLFRSNKILYILLIKLDGSPQIRSHFITM